jgi:hypothetical protein
MSINININRKTNLIVTKLSGVYKEFLLKQYNAKRIDLFTYSGTFFGELLKIVTSAIDYTTTTLNKFEDVMCLCSNDMFKLFSAHKKNHFSLNEDIHRHVYNYDKPGFKNPPNQAPSDYTIKYISWNILIKLVITFIDRTSNEYTPMSKLMLKYDNAIKQIVNHELFKSRTILNMQQYSVIILKLIKINIKLKEELIDALQNTHIYNYILQKMHDLATLIDFGYNYKKSKDSVFNTSVISLSQVFDLLLISDNEEIKEFKTFLVKNNIYLDALMVYDYQIIFSWDQLLKIINKYTNIDSVNEKKYMKYLHKMYTECICEIFEEIN